MGDQLDEPDDEGLEKHERIELSRFHDAFTAYAEQEHRRFIDAFTPLIDHHNTVFGDISRKIAEAATLKVNIPKVAFDIPTPMTTAVSDAVQRIVELSDFNSTMREMVETINERLQAQWQDLFESLGNVAAQIFPENWEGVPTPSIEDLESILIDEGIPLMWVPGPKVVEALIKADSASARRRIIGSRWKGIISDCEATLESIDHPKILDQRDFAAKCVAALRDGHSETAQALAACLLDTILRCHLDKDDRMALDSNDFKHNGVKFNLDDYKFRAALAFAPVWFAHARYYSNRGDSVPHTFSRHPSVHAVSRAQYSRVNSVTGLMVVTSFLKFLNAGLPR